MPPLANIGTTLRAARVKRGLSIEQAAQDTRISRKFLEAIEAEDFGALPAPVYVRGFLRSYANYLRIDPLPLLDQVNAVLERPIAGPDDFVSGPGPASQQRPRSGSDPWRRRGVEPIPPPPPQRGPFGRRNTADDAPEWDTPDNEYEDTMAAQDPRRETPAQERARGVVPYPPPYPRQAEPAQPEYDDDRRDDDQYEDDDYVEPAVGYVPPMEPIGPETYEQPRRRRQAGVLAEREQRERGGIPPMFLAIAGGALVVGIFGVLALLAFRSSPDDDDPANGSGDDPTATVNITTQVAVGSRTPSVTASASPSASASASTTGTPSVTGTPGTATPTATATQQGAATATQTPPGATPTPSPTVEPTATTAPPTATQVPPTATTAPPTATPTIPIIAHPFGYAECSGGNCGNPPLLVVCAPDGWFVDVGANFPNPGWPTRSVTKASDAQGVCP